MNYYEDKVFTDDELIVRVMDKEEIKKLMAKRAFYYANNQRRRELDELWVKTPEYKATASYGRNWGYYVGMDSIANYYVVEHTKKQYADLEAIHANDPTIAVSSQNLGLGCTAFHTVTTPMLYIAGDGATARGLWYSAGQETIMQADGTAKAYWTMDNMAADFVKENGQWKIWHLIMTRDHTMPNGEDYSEKVPARKLKKGEDPLDSWDGEPTMSDHKVYEPFFGWEYLYQDMPKPYYTYTDLEGYGPYSNMGYDYFGREKRNV